MMLQEAMTTSLVNLQLLQAELDKHQDGGLVGGSHIATGRGPGVEGPPEQLTRSTFEPPGEITNADHGTPPPTTIPSQIKTPIPKSDHPTSPNELPTPPAQTSTSTSADNHNSDYDSASWSTDDSDGETDFPPAKMPHPSKRLHFPRLARPAKAPFQFFVPTRSEMNVAKKAKVAENEWVTDDEECPTAGWRFGKGDETIVGRCEVDTPGEEVVGGLFKGKGKERAAGDSWLKGGTDCYAIMEGAKENPRPAGGVIIAETDGDEQPPLSKESDAERPLSEQSSRAVEAFWRRMREHSEAKKSKKMDTDVIVTDHQASRSTEDAKGTPADVETSESMEKDISTAPNTSGLEITNDKLKDSAVSSSKEPSSTLPPRTGAADSGDNAVLAKAAPATLPEDISLPPSEPDCDGEDCNVCVEDTTVVVDAAPSVRATDKTADTDTVQGVHPAEEIGEEQDSVDDMYERDQISDVKRGKKKEVEESPVLGDGSGDIAAPVNVHRPKSYIKDRPTPGFLASADGYIEAYDEQTSVDVKDSMKQESIDGTGPSEANGRESSLSADLHASPSASSVGDVVSDKAYKPSSFGGATGGDWTQQVQGSFAAMDVSFGAKASTSDIDTDDKCTPEVASVHPTVDDAIIIKDSPEQNSPAQKTESAKSSIPSPVSPIPNFVGFGSAQPVRDIPPTQVATTLPGKARANWTTNVQSAFAAMNFHFETQNSASSSKVPAAEISGFTAAFGAMNIGDSEVKDPQSGRSTEVKPSSTQESDEGYASLPASQEALVPASQSSPPPFKTFIPALPLGLSTAADQIPTTKEHLLQSFTRVLMGMHHRPMPKFGKNVEFLCTVGLTVAFGLLPILRIPLQALVLESRGDHSARLHPLSFTIAAYHLQSTRLMRESMTHLVRWLMAAKIPDYLAAIQRIRDECDNATAELVQKEVMTVERNLTQLLKKTVVIVTREKGGYQIDYSGVSLEPGEEREFMSRYDGLGYGKKATRELEPELSLLKTNNSIHPVGTDVGLTCTYVRDADMPWTMPRWPEDDGA